MDEISYQDLKAYLKQLEASSDRRPAPVHLIHGEDFLVRATFEEILQRVLPDAAGNLNYEPLDGAVIPIADVVACLNTYSLMGGTKLVALRDARLFHAKEAAAKLLDSARTARTEGDLPRAAKHFLAALAQLNLTVEDVRASDRSLRFPDGYDAGEDETWIEAILDHCAIARLTVPAAADDAGILERAIARGFPKGHHLIITTDWIDRRRNLYKIIRERGVVIDCAVPKGDRRADKEAQEAALADHMKSVLEPARKAMSREAFLALCEMTGFDLGTFSNNLRILIDYAGQRSDITAEDVEATLTRTKKDPLYELTNAVTDRNWDRSLFFLDALLAGEIHGLQALAAIANQIRKLLVAKDFTASAAGATWQPACTYAQFQKSVLPAVVAFDRELLERIGAWEAGRLAEGPTEGPKKKKTAKAGTDLQLARNPGNPFPVYQTLKKADRFRRAELLGALKAIGEADVKLKSSALHPRLILERVVWQICSPKAGEKGRSSPRHAIA
jgi:DNA polymerase-3 subunit delta